MSGGGLKTVLLENDQAKRYQEFIDRQAICLDAVIGNSIELTAEVERLRAVVNKYEEDGND